VDKRVPFISGLPLIGEAFKNTDQHKQSREIAVFVTAHIIREPGTVARGPSSEPLGIGSRPQPAGPEYTDQIRDALRNQTR
jgi:type II secretory pathway component GspD/PulD (secretin)